MMKRIFILGIILLTCISITSAQNNKAANQSKIVQEQAGRPDVPGDLFAEIGFNMLQDNEAWDSKLWGSKIFNVYYQLNKNIGDSRFSFHPGIGIGTEKYAFKEDSTLTYGLDEDNNRQVEVTTINPDWNVRKSKIATTYLDIPLELRWRSMKYDPKRSLKISIGAKVGLLLDAHTKIKYDEFGEKKVIKRKENFGINKIRYGAFAKVGYGNAYLFYNHSFSYLFDEGEGPQDTEMYPINFGLALSLF